MRVLGGIYWGLGQRILFNLQSPAHTAVVCFKTAASPSMDAGASPSMARSLLKQTTAPRALHQRYIQVFCR